MASITFHFRPSSRGLEQAGSLFLRIIHSRKVLSITTSYRIYPCEWDSEQRSFVIPLGDSSRAKYLLDTEDRLNREIRRFTQIIAELEKSGFFTVDDIARTYRISTKLTTIKGFTEKLAVELCESSQERTARAYRTSVRALIIFTKQDDIRLDHINASLVRAFERDLKSRGKSMNTISFYMRNLRAIYNKAISEGRIQPRLENPFSHVYTGVFVTRKRALSKDEVIVLNNLDLTITSGKSDPASDSSSTELLSVEYRRSLAMFLFCFHARGMSFVDMAFLTKRSVKKDTITYSERKRVRCSKLR